MWLCVVVPLRCMWQCDTAISSGVVQQVRVSCGSTSRDVLFSLLARQVVADDVLARYKKFVLTQSNTNLRFGVPCAVLQCLPHTSHRGRVRGVGTRRECPECGHLQQGSPRWPAMQCEKCATRYCFLHSRAHVGLTCRQWQRVNAQALKASHAFITSHTIAWYAAAVAHDMQRPRWRTHASCVSCSPRPSCGLPVSKISGCNHSTFVGFACIPVQVLNALTPTCVVQ